MKVLRTRNVHDVLPVAMRLLKDEGVLRDSRAGKVLVMPEPVTTVYSHPTERVIFWNKRDANPFFHFMEGLWMLAGRNDVKWISQFSSNIAQFSDDQNVLHGAYGYRWIKHFYQQVEVLMPEFPHAGYTQSFDQLETIAKTLKENPNDRRCVLQMWDCQEDLGRNGKDVPCNTQIYFKISLTGALDMTVLCRSNDIIWGAYGANAVHMSMLQEFMAAWIDVPAGRYFQVSNDWHAYVNVFDKHVDVMTEQSISPYDAEGLVSTFPMINSGIREWRQDLKDFIDLGPTAGFNDRFFRRVAVPIYQAWLEWKDKEKDHPHERALAALSGCDALDWKVACSEWLNRRVVKS